MKCPEEFILAQYADGELPEAATREVVLHLELCARCRDLAAALKAENRALVESLQGIDLEPVAQESIRPEVRDLCGMSRAAAALASAAVLLRAGYGLMQGLELPLGLDWLHPLTMPAQLNWVGNGLFYLIDEGGSMITSLVNQAGAAVLGLLAVFGLMALARRKIGVTGVFSLVSLMLVFALPGYAIEIRNAKKDLGSITVEPGEVVDDTLVVAGQFVNIRGTVTGDVIAFARQVNVQGTVQGNVIGFGTRVDVTGDVQGDIFAFGQTVQANGHVGGNLWGFGQTLLVGSGARLDKDAVLFGSEADISSDIGRDLLVFAGGLDVGSRIGRDLSFRGGRLMVRTPSAIGRDLKVEVKAEKNVQIDPAVTIGGKKITKIAEPKPSRYRTFRFYMRQLLRLGAMFVTGIVLILLFPNLGRVPLSTVRDVSISGGIGFLALVAVPVAVILLAITVIGIPVAAAAFVLWLLCLYLAKIVVAKCVGSVIMGTKEGEKWGTVMALLAGLAVVLVAVNLPYIGGILNFLLILIGLGALVIAIYRACRKTVEVAQ
jgi:hypothetical protein